MHIDRDRSAEPASTASLIEEIPEKLSFAHLGVGKGETNNRHAAKDRSEENAKERLNKSLPLDTSISSDSDNNRNSQDLIAEETTV